MKTNTPSYLSSAISNTIILNAVRDDSSLDAVLIDLDSCLLDFFGSFLPILNEHTGKTYVEEDFHTFDIDKVADISYEEVLGLLKDSEYMLNMKPFLRTVEFLQACRDKGMRIVLSTSRVFAKHCVDHTVENLKTLGFDFEELHLVSGNKWEHKSDPNIRYLMYFDDSPTHLENYYRARDAGEEVPTMLFAPVIPYNSHLHEQHDDLIYLDLRDPDIDYATLLPTY